MKKWMNYLPYALVIIILASLIVFSNDSRTENFDYSTFVREAENMEFQQSSISVGTTVIDVQGTYEDEKGTAHSFTVSVPKTDENIQWLTDTLGEGRIAVTDPNRENQFMNILVSLLPVLLMVGVFFIFFSKMNAGGNNKAFDFAKSRAKIQSNVKVRFKDVAGCDEEKEEVREIIDYLKNPKQFTDMGARIPKGLLMVGPPGTGKTLLAKAVAGEADVPFFSISGSDFVEMFVGTGASRVRDMFKKAQQAAPCIVFIDEIDAVGRQRGAGMGGGNDEREQTLNQLLAEMDGFDGSKGVVILAATNRPETLDKALLRPGRFDRRIPVELPDLKGREEILKVHVKDIVVDSDIDYRTIALSTSGASGAELANIVNEAALAAVRNGHSKVMQHDFDEAVDTVIAGKERKGAVISEKEKRIIAYHEIGHALVAAVSKNSAPVHKITIIPHTNGSLGYTMQVAEQESVLMSKDEILEKIRTLTGGRAAEEFMFNICTSGASNDIEQATRLARAMVAQLGMSDQFGMTALETVNNRYLSGDASLVCSNETATLIDKEVMAIIKNAHAEARKILEDNAQLLHEEAEYLLQKETITGEEFMEIFSRHQQLKALPQPSAE